MIYEELNELYITSRGMESREGDQEQVVSTKLQQKPGTQHPRNSSHDLYKIHQFPEYIQ